jgi:hypothetical protein
MEFSVLIGDGMTDTRNDGKLVMVAHNHVAIKPPPYLHQVLVKLFEGTSVRAVAADMFHATIFYSKVPLMTFTPDPAKEFQAQLAGSRIWYDSYMGCHNLIVNLDSPDMEERNKEIEEKYNGVSVYPVYVTHLTMVYDIPMTHKRISILNAFTDYMEDYLIGETITLTGEYLESTSGLAKALGLKPELM